MESLHISVATKPSLVFHVELYKWHAVDTFVCCCM